MKRLGACLLVGLLGCAAAVAGPAAEGPKPWPEKMVAAWKKAGAEVIWADDDTFSSFQDLTGLKGKGPVFFFKGKPAGGWEKLPAVGQPFGLFLGGLIFGGGPGTATDADLRGIAALKGLRFITVGGTEVTDAGLKELAGLEQLQTLIIDSTRVTGAGLKELVHLKKLHTLTLPGPVVTDGALASLREAGLLHALAQAKGPAG
jgi:hypothetical protein